MQYIEIAHVIDDVLNTSIWAIPVAEGMKMLENDESYKIPTIEFSKSQLGERFISQKELFDMTSKLGKLLSKIPKNMKCVVDQHSINRKKRVDWTGNGSKVWIQPIGHATFADDLSYEIFKVSLLQYRMYLRDQTNNK